MLKTHQTKNLTTDTQNAVAPGKHNIEWHFPAAQALTSNLEFWFINPIQAGGGPYQPPQLPFYMERGNPLRYYYLFVWLFLTFIGAHYSKKIFFMVGPPSTLGGCPKMDIYQKYQKCQNDKILLPWTSL